MGLNSWFWVHFWVHYHRGLEVRLEQGHKFVLIARGGCSVQRSRKFVQVCRGSHQGSGVQGNRRGSVQELGSMLRYHVRQEQVLELELGGML
jgi:hypothetical protein